MSAKWVRVERNIYRRGDVLVARWRDGQGVRQQATVDTVTEARAVLAEVATRKARGKSTDYSRRREDLSTWWERYRLSTTTNAKSSRARDASLWRNHVGPAFGSVEVGSITPSDIEAFQAEKLAAGRWKPTTVRDIMTLLGAVLNIAVRDQVLDANPAGFVKRPRIDPGEAEFLELHEVGALERAMLPWWRPTVTTMVCTGVRIGELGAVRVRDVNLVEGWLRVTAGSIQPAGVRGLPKSSAGGRVVPTLPKSLCRTLEKLIADRNLGPDDLLFTGPRGGRLESNNYRNRVWNPAVERAGLVGATPHSLRHTAVSIWLQRGVEPLRIARWAGHADTAFLQRVYGHLLSDPEADRHREEMDQLLEAARARPPQVRRLGS